ncbi:hypothetical protein HK100_011182, partial [Physocladia obscura]
MEELFDSDSLTDIRLQEMLRLEANTWQLVDALLDIRIPADDAIAPKMPNAYSSDQAIVKYVTAMDVNLTEIMAIKRWLEATAPELIPTETRKGYRPYTQKSVRSFSPRGNVALDPDGPIRTNTPLATEDLKYEQSLNRTLFSHVRRGRIDDAIELCRACDEPWRAASFSGAVYFRDDFVDGILQDEVAAVGNVNRDLWKETCDAIASEPSFDRYERAVYAALSGNTEHVLPVCKTWEDFVWAHYNNYAEALLSNHFATIPQMSKPNDEFQKLHSVESAKLPAELFEWLSHCENLELIAAAQNPFRIFQALLIVNRVDVLLMSVHQQLVQESHSIPELPTVLRFVVHLILALRSVSYPIEAKDSAHFIVYTYIQMLVAAQKKSIVAIYVGQLPVSHQIEAYAPFLENINGSKDERAEFVKQGEKCGIDMHMACKRAVELSFRGGIFEGLLPTKASMVFVSNMDDEIDQVSYKQIRALEWLLFDPLQQSDALIQCNKLIRRFL